MEVDRRSETISTCSPFENVKHAIGTEWHLTWVFAFGVHTHIALRCNHKNALQSTNCTFNSSKERAHPTRCDALRIHQNYCLQQKFSPTSPRYDHEADGDDDAFSAVLTKQKKMDSIFSFTPKRWHRFIDGNIFSMQRSRFRC